MPVDDYESLGYVNMRLGNIFRNSYIENNEPIERYRKAFNYYSLSGNKKYQQTCLGVIGALYRNLHRDSAYIYKYGY
ncbi:MAG: hypothetical protein PHR45_01775 [Muribaculaceae bacterium]|nr:hypothetical protein [Muribaculaceae bacterium]